MYFIPPDILFLTSFFFKLNVILFAGEARAPNHIKQKQIIFHRKQSHSNPKFILTAGKSLQGNNIPFFVEGEQHMDDFNYIVETGELSL